MDSNCSEESDYEPKWLEVTRLIDVSSEIIRYIIGPMPVVDFLQMFFRPNNPTPLPTFSYDKCELLPEFLDREKLSELRKKLIEAIQPICLNLELKDTHSTPISAWESLPVQPDICIFNKGIRDVDILDPSKPEIMIKLKPSYDDDPFDDNGENRILRKDGTSEIELYFTKNTKASRCTLGQITAYAAAQQAAQFRIHIFSILVFPEHARLLRWDRSGVIVTERFPICSQYFMEFFRLYNYATPQTRGIDLSVTTPSSEDALKAQAVLDNTTLLPLVQLSLGFSSYIVSRKLYMNHGCPLGRSTRTFIAYSISHNDKVFLKDSWRFETQTPEHQVYKHLHRNNVPHIPTVVEGGDVLDHTTLTQDLIEEDAVWIRNRVRMRKHIHYRIVFQEVATPLCSFPSTKIMVTAIHDAMIAHRTAYFEADILHRNISPSNIMIYNKGGLLIDWDLSRNINGADAQSLGRKGTWQFMSARILMYPAVEQDITDDVESFVHVITWVGFKYAKHSMADEDLDAYLTINFDNAYTKGITMGGGLHKMRNLLIPIELDRYEFESPNLQRLLQNITETIAARYDSTSPPPSSFRGSVAFLEYLQEVHQEKLEKLGDSSKWLISEFSLALSLPDWLDDDAARKYEVTTNN